MTKYEGELTLFGVPLTITDTDLSMVLRRAMVVANNANATVSVYRRSDLFEQNRLIASIEPKGVRCVYQSDIFGDELRDVLSVFSDAKDEYEIRSNNDYVPIG